MVEETSSPLFPFNIYLVGVGGQGILTIGEIISQAAFLEGIPVNFFPTKGMAQRGGFVKAQLRLGKAMVGPAIPEKGANLVIAMERSESLKAVRFLKPGGDFLLWDFVWAPTAVMLGKESYPEWETVREKVNVAGGNFISISPSLLPRHEGKPVPDNTFILGIALKRTSLGKILPYTSVEEAIQKRFPRFSEVNLLALKSGFTLEL